MEGNQTLESLISLFIPIIFGIILGILAIIGFRYFRFRKKYGNYDLSDKDFSHLWKWK